MDAETKKEIKNRLWWFFRQPMFMWLLCAMTLLWGETLFRDHEHYHYILLGFMFLYLFCMLMFMYKMEAASIENMRYWETKNMPYLTDMIGKGLGAVTYMIIIGEPEGFVRRWKMKLFGTQYICPYMASFLDTGTVHQKAHLQIPVTSRQVFQLKLMGCHKTHDREVAVKALEYLGVEWPLP